MRLLPVDELRPGMMVERDVYSASDSVVPIIQRSTILRDSIIRRLKEHGVREIYVDGDEQPFFIAPKPKPSIPPQLQEEAIENLGMLFDMVSLKEIDQHQVVQVVQHLDEVVYQLIDSLSTDENALVNIVDLKSYDEYTYHHSLSVAVLSIAIAQKLGIKGAALRNIGRSAMMHDIGKTAIPVEIINKPSRLNDMEFTLIKRHSFEGYDYLSKAEIGEDWLWNAVLCHHEKIDGTGYPNGLKGNEIPLASRIISVADVYDALTSNRPYRNPMQPAEAVEYIMGNIDSIFDYDIASAFLRKLELYPVGSFIELSNGAVGVVLNNQNAMRPVIRNAKTGTVIDLGTDRNYLSVVIKRIVPDYVIGAG